MIIFYTNNITYKNIFVSLLINHNNYFIITYKTSNIVNHLYKVLVKFFLAKRTQRIKIYYVLYFIPRKYFLNKIILSYLIIIVMILEETVQ